jgi:hypothetical protein
LTPEAFRSIKEWDCWKNIEELDSVKEILDRIDTSLQRLETLKEGL